MRVLDLFSGIGGFSLGLERAGMETVAFCEISPVCRHLLAYHWPNVPCFDDVTTLTGEQVGPVDVICGGFPCQDISFAGKGAGLAGERSGLWREYARLVRELRPAFVIVENVAALLGRGLGDVLGDLASLGYDAWWDCIPASAVGAPHRRDRLWIVAYARGQQHEGFGDALRREIAAGLHEADLANASERERYVVALEESREHQRQRSITTGGRGVSPHVADAQGDRRRKGRAKSTREQRRPRAAGSGPSMAHTESERCGEEGQCGPRQSSQRTGGRRWPISDDWLSEPDVGRVAHGVPARVDRLHGLGNAVVPKIPKIIGCAIMSAAASRQEIAA